MSVDVITVTAKDLDELDVRVQVQIARGFERVGNVSELRVGGQQPPGRDRWMQIMSRRVRG